MILYAEVVCIDCEDGNIFPIEIAFATSSKDVYILRVSPKEYYWLTVRDVYSTRSKMRNKDRFYNSEITGVASIKPIAKYKLHASIWLLELREFIAEMFPGEVHLRVRGRYQYNFFKYTCGFINVSKIWIKTGVPVMNVDHKHNSRFINYPCPGIEVRTMAYHDGNKKLLRPRKF